MSRLGVLGRSILLVGAAATGGLLYPAPVTERQPPPAKAKAERRVVEITARLDKQEAKPGETVRLTEVIAAAKDVKVIGFGHEVYYTGLWDRKLGRLVAFGPERFLPSPAPHEFDRLPAAAVSTRWIEFDVKSPREKGFEFEFRPRHLGIFLITASWTVEHADDPLYSQPVILTVTPPLDVKGQPEVKPEWYSTY